MVMIKINYMKKIILTSFVFLLFICNVFAQTAGVNKTKRQNARDGYSGNVNYVNERGRIVTGPEYLTIFNGLTGTVMKTVDYVPGRGDICAWGANECKTNRVDRFLAWQNVVYNQPPHLGFYIGDGIDKIGMPNIFTFNHK
jgi:hypothetical protein